MRPWQSTIGFFGIGAGARDTPLVEYARRNGDFRLEANKLSGRKYLENCKSCIRLAEHTQR